MDKHILKRMMTLMAVPGLAVMGLLLVSLALGRSASGAQPAKMRPDTGSFTPVAFAPDITLNKEEHVCGGVWVTETVDSDGNVGWDTTLALEPTYPYAPHMSYGKAITVQDNDLKYARLSGDTWLSETVDSGGFPNSLALVPTYPYTPCIAYADYWGGAELRYACRDGITWTIMTITRGWWLGRDDISLALEPVYPYTPHIAFNWGAGVLQNLGHMYLSGTEWMSGTWVVEELEPALSLTGWSLSLALEPTYPYTPHISYNHATFSGAPGDLRHAWRSGTTWLTETVEGEGDVGYSNSLALDSNGMLCISYVDRTHGSLKYAWLSGTTWLSETVASTGWGEGMATSLKLDRADAPYISYYDAISGDLKLAWLKGGVWIIQTVDSDGDVGQMISLALNRVGRPHISYYDAINGDLKHAYIPMPKVYLPVVFKN